MDKRIFLFFLIVLSLMTVTCVCASPNQGNVNATTSNMTLHDSTHIPIQDTINETLNLHANESTYNNLSMNHENNLFSASSDIEVSDDVMGIHIIFEGVKVYGLADEYQVKVLDKNNNPLTEGNVTFCINDIPIFDSSLNSEGIAKCILPVYGNITVTSYYWNSLTDIYDIFGAEQITVGNYSTNSYQMTTYGSAFKKWSDIEYELHDDGYYALIDKNTYHWIKFTGERYIIHKEEVNELTRLNEIFRLISNSVEWDIIELNLTKKEYRLVSGTFSDKEWDYIARLNHGQLIINGNGATLISNRNSNMMYVGSDANVAFYNMTISNFNHVFINHGYILCDSVSFKENRAYKVDVDESGAVAHNYQFIYLKSCYFKDNQATKGIYANAYGTILESESGSMNIFDRCDFADMDDNDKNRFIYAKGYSTVVFYQDRELHPNFKKSYFDHNTCVCSISSKVSQGIANTTAVINCSSATQLKKVLYTVNSLAPGPSIVINLKKGTYEFDSDLLDTSYGSKLATEIFLPITIPFIDSMYPDNFNFRSCDWRYSYYNPNGLAYTSVVDKYMLDVGVVPITINGNGSTIKIINGAKNNDDHFAFIGCGGNLTVNNLTFSQFNTVFHNNGNLVLNNCRFIENKIEYKSTDYGHGGVLASNIGCTIFNNCYFKSNFGEENTHLVYLDSTAHVEFINCSIDNDNYVIKGYSYVISDDSLEYVDYAFFNVTDENYSNIIHYLDRHKVNYLYLNLTKDYDFYSLDGICAHVNYVIVRSNGYNLLYWKELREFDKVLYLDGFDLSNQKNFIYNAGTTYFHNCTFSNNDGDYLLSNKGTCCFINCTFINNKCKNVFENNGFLNFENCNFYDNSATDHGLIYNNGGSVSCSFCDFKDNTGTELHNFHTIDYNVIGCTSIKVIIEQPMANWKLDLIKTGIFLGVGFASLGAGAAIGTALGATVTGMVLSAIAGAAIGSVGGIIYGQIEASTYRDYTNQWSYILPFAMIGAYSASIGFSVSISKYYAPPEQVSQQNPDGLGPGNLDPGNLGPGDGGNLIDDASTEISLDGHINDYIDEQIGDINELKIDKPIGDSDFISLMGRLVPNYLALTLPMPVQYRQMFDGYYNTYRQYYNNDNRNPFDWLNLYIEIDMMFHSIQEIASNSPSSAQNPNTNPISQNPGVINPPAPQNPGVINPPAPQNPNADNNPTFEDSVLHRLTNNTFFERLVPHTLDPHFNNETHLRRAVNLLNNLHNLYELISSNIPFDRLPTNLRSTLELFNRIQYQRSTISAFLNDRYTRNRDTWQIFYEQALQEWQNFNDNNGNDEKLFDVMNRQIGDYYSALLKTNKFNDEVRKLYEKYCRLYIQYSHGKLTDMSKLISRYNELLQFFTKMKDESSLENTVIKQPTNNLNKKEMKKLAGEAKDEAIKYIEDNIGIDNAGYKTIISSVDELYNSFISNINYNGDLDLQYGKFIDSLNELITGKPASKLREVNIEFDKEANLYERIFNLPKWFKQNTDKTHSYTVLYKDLMLLKMIDPYLYDTALRLISKNLNSKKDYDVKAYLNDLNCSQLTKIYMKIFKILNIYRDNAKIYSNEGSVIMEAIKYRFDASLLDNYFNVLSKNQQVEITAYLLVESQKMMQNYNGKADVGEIKNILNAIDINNINEIQFNRLVSCYNRLWSVNFDVNYLNGIDPNTLSSEALGELIINNLANVMLIKGDDTRIDFKLTNLNIFGNVYLSYASTKILYLVQKNTKESREELIGLFNDVKFAYDYTIIFSYLNNELYLNILNEIDYNFLSKFPVVYDLSIAAIFSAINNIIIPKHYSNLDEFHKSLRSYVRVPTSEVLFLFVDVFNYFSKNKDLNEDQLLNYYKNAYDKFLDTVKPSLNKYNQFIDIRKIFDKSSGKNELDRSFSVWRLLEKKYPPIALVLKRDVIKGDTTDFFKEHNHNEVLMLFYNYLLDYFKFKGNGNYPDKYKIIDKMPTDYFTKEDIEKITKEAWLSAKAYCSVISKTDLEFGNEMINKVEKLYNQVYAKYSREKTTLEEYVNGYNSFVDQLNALFVEFIGVNNELSIKKNPKLNTDTHLDLDYLKNHPDYYRYILSSIYRDLNNTFSNLYESTGFLFFKEFNSLLNDFRYMDNKATVRLFVNIYNYVIVEKHNGLEILNFINCEKSVFLNYIHANKVLDNYINEILKEIHSNNIFNMMWSSFTHKYPSIAEYINKELIKDDVNNYLQKYSANARKLISDKIKNYFESKYKDMGNLQIDNPDNQKIFDEIKQIMENKQLKNDNNIINDDDLTENGRYFINSWDAFEQKYPEIAINILKNYLHKQYIGDCLIGDNPDTDQLRMDVISYAGELLKSSKSNFEFIIVKPTNFAFLNQEEIYKLALDVFNNASILIDFLFNPDIDRVAHDKAKSDLKSLYDTFDIIFTDEHIDNYIYVYYLYVLKVNELLNNNLKSNEGINLFNYIFNMPEFVKYYKHVAGTCIKIDMELLKEFNQTTYDYLMGKYFDGKESVENWIYENNAIQNYDLLAKKYINIFMDLSSFRDNWDLLKNEHSLIFEMSIKQTVTHDLEFFKDYYTYDERIGLVKFLLDECGKYIELCDGETKVEYENITEGKLSSLRTMNRAINLYHKVIGNRDFGNLEIFNISDFVKLNITEMGNVLFHDLNVLSRLPYSVYNDVLEKYLGIEYNLNAFESYMRSKFKIMSLVKDNNRETLVSVCANIGVEHQLNSVAHSLFNEQLVDYANSKTKSEIEKTFLRELNIKNKKEIEKLLDDIKNDNSRIKALIKIYKFYHHFDNIDVANAQNLINITLFNDIKCIMENRNIKAGVASDLEGYDNLAGCWNKIKKQYPNIADKVTNDLFKNNKLKKYSRQCGGCEKARENIIHYIKEHLLKNHNPAYEIIFNLPILYHNKNDNYANTFKEIIDILNDCEIAENATVDSPSFKNLEESWNEIVKSYPNIAKVLTKKILNDKLEKFVEKKCSNDCDEARGVLVEDIEDILENIAKYTFEINITSLQNLFYDDLMALKVINVQLYNDVLTNVFNLKSEKELSKHLKSLNRTQLYESYDSIFKMLGVYRDNVELISNQESLLINAVTSDNCLVYKLDLQGVFFLIKNNITGFLTDLLKSCGEMVDKNKNAMKYKLYVQRYDSLKNKTIKGINIGNLKRLYDLYISLKLLNETGDYFEGVNPDELNINELGDLINTNLFKFFHKFTDGVIKESTFGDSSLSKLLSKVSNLVSRNTPESKTELVNIFNELKNAYSFCIYATNILYKIKNNLQVSKTDLLKCPRDYEYYRFTTNTLAGEFYDKMMKQFKNKNVVSNIVSKFTKKLIGRSLSPIVACYAIDVYNNSLLKKTLIQIIDFLKDYDFNKLKLDDNFYNLTPIKLPQEISVDVNRINGVKQFKIKSYNVNYLESELIESESLIPLDFKFNKLYNTYVAFTQNGKIIVSKDYYALLRLDNNVLSVNGKSLKPTDVVYNADGKAILAQDMEYKTINRNSVDLYARNYYIGLNEVPETQFAPGKLYYYANGNLVPAGKIVVKEGYVFDVKGNRLFSNRIGDKYEPGATYYTFTGKKMNQNDILIDSDGYVVDSYGNLLFKKPLKGKNFPKNIPKWNKEYKEKTEKLLNFAVNRITESKLYNQYGKLHERYENNKNNDSLPENYFYDTYYEILFILLDSIHDNFIDEKYKNPYDTVFNYKTHVNQITDVNILSSILEYDLYQLKLINSTLYNKIKAEISDIWINDFNDESGFNIKVTFSLIHYINNDEAQVLISAYNQIFEKLSEFRNNSKLLNSETQRLANDFNSLNQNINYYTGLLTSNDINAISSKFYNTFKTLQEIFKGINGHTSPRIDSLLGNYFYLKNDTDEQYRQYDMKFIQDSIKYISTKLKYYSPGLLFMFNDLDTFKLLPAQKMAEILNRNIEVIYKFSNDFYHSLGNKVLKNNYIEFKYYVNDILTHQNAQNELIAIYEYVHYHILQNSLRIEDSIAVEKTMNYNDLDVFMGKCRENKMLKLINHNLKSYTKYNNERDWPLILEKYNEKESKGTYKMNLTNFFLITKIQFKLNILSQDLEKDENYSMESFDVVNLWYKVYKWNQTCREGYNHLMKELKDTYSISDLHNLTGIKHKGTIYVYNEKGELIEYSALYRWVLSTINLYIGQNALIFDMNSNSFIKVKAEEENIKNDDEYDEVLFNKIKEILENPDGQSNFINTHSIPGMDTLLGCWDNLQDKYPDIAYDVDNSLFENGLVNYIVDCKDVNKAREGILKYIKEYLINNNDNSNKGMDLKNEIINTEKISEKA